MKLETKYKDTSLAIEFTSEEIGNFIPFFIRALFNKKTVTIKTYSLLEKILVVCQNNHGWKIFSYNRPYLKEERICLLMEQMPFFIKNSVKNRFISEFTIDSYEKSNVFFAAMDLFFQRLQKNDIKKIFKRFIDNNQTSLPIFFEEIEKKKPKLLTPEIKKYLVEEKLKIESGNG